jgi:hypothetical protein
MAEKLMVVVENDPLDIDEKELLAVLNRQTFQLDAGFNGLSDGLIDNLDRFYFAAEYLRKFSKSGVLFVDWSLGRAFDVNSAKTLVTDRELVLLDLIQKSGFELNPSRHQGIYLAIVAAANTNADLDIVFANRSGDQSALVNVIREFSRTRRCIGIGSLSQKRDRSDEFSEVAIYEEKIERELKKYHEYREIDPNFSACWWPHSMNNEFAKGGKIPHNPLHPWPVELVGHLKSIGIDSDIQSKLASPAKEDDDLSLSLWECFKGIWGQKAATQRSGGTTPLSVGTVLLTGLATVQQSQICDVLLVDGGVCLQSTLGNHPNNGRKIVHELMCFFEAIGRTEPIQMASHTPSFWFSASKDTITVGVDFDGLRSNKRGHSSLLECVQDIETTGGLSCSGEASLALAKVQSMCPKMKIGGSTKAGDSGKVWTFLEFGSMS